jgi:hypothetical protein
MASGHRDGGDADSGEGLEASKCKTSAFRGGSRTRRFFSEFVS